MDEWEVLTFNCVFFANLYTENSSSTPKASLWKLTQLLLPYHRGLASPPPCHLPVLYLKERNITSFVCVYLSPENTFAISIPKHKNVHIRREKGMIIHALCVCV